MRLRMVVISGAAAALVAVGMTRGAFAQQAASDVSLAASLFEAKCKGCHEPAIDRAPSRDALAQRTPESVVQALTAGSMQAMASGLAPDMIRQVAIYVTGKPLATAADPASVTGVQPPDNKCAANPPIKSAKTDWNGYGKTAASSRFQETTNLNAANVSRLKVKWS